MSSEATTPPTIRPGVVYEVTRQLASLPDSLKLHHLEWGVLFAVTGEHTVAQIGDHFGLTHAARDTAFARLHELGLIRERPVSYSEYLRSVATIDDGTPKTLSQFLRAGAAMGVGAVAKPPVGALAPKASRDANDAKPRRPVAALVEDPEVLNVTRAVPTFKSPEDLEALKRQVAADRAAAEATGTQPESTLDPSTVAPPTFQPLATPAGDLDLANDQPPPSETETAEAERRLSLKRVIQLILDRAADLNTGQLDVYRVFIRVDTKLLKRNGITTLRFEDDRLIGDPELQGAIVSSMQRTLGLYCPDNAYVTVAA